MMQLHACLLIGLIVISGCGVDGDEITLIGH